MNWEKKYLKYKIKYLKLSLNLKNQKGSGDVPTNNQILEWPRDYKLIDAGANFYQVENFIPTDKFAKNDLKNVSTLDAHPKGQIEFVDENKLYLVNIKVDNIPWPGWDRNNLLHEYDFTKEYFSKLFLKKIISTDNNDKYNLPLEQKELINSNKMDNENINSNDKILQHIKQLEDRLNQLDNKLENHYHILPTSGMKNFEQSHPYYNRKLD